MFPGPREHQVKKNFLIQLTVLLLGYLRVASLVHLHFVAFLRTHDSNNRIRLATEQRVQVERPLDMTCAPAESSW